MPTMSNVTNIVARFRRAKVSATFEIVLANNNWGYREAPSAAHLTPPISTTEGVALSDLEFIQFLEKAVGSVTAMALEPSRSTISISNQKAEVVAVPAYSHLRFTLRWWRISPATAEQVFLKKIEIFSDQQTAEVYAANVDPPVDAPTMSVWLANLAAHPIPLTKVKDLGHFMPTVLGRTIPPDDLPGPPSSSPMAGFPRSRRESRATCRSRSTAWRTAPRESR